MKNERFEHAINQAANYFEQAHTVIENGQLWIGKALEAYLMEAEIERQPPPQAPPSHIGGIGNTGGKIYYPFQSESEKYDIALGRCRANRQAPVPPPHIDKLIVDKNANFEAAQEETMPPIYESITVRPRGKKGLLEYRFTYEGKRYSIYARSKKDCWDEYIKIITGKKQKSVPAQNFESVAWSWYNRYRKQKQSPRQQEETQKLLHEICETFGAKDIRRITTDELQDYANSLSPTPRKRDVVMCLVKAIFKKSTPRIIKVDPCSDLELVKHKGKGHPVIQLAQQRSIFEREDSEIHKKIFMAYCCLGTRLSEFFNGLPNIDFQNHIFEVVDEDTSTKKHRRQIPFLSELMNEADRDEFLKLTSHGVQQHFSKLFKRIRIKASFHSFRVTFISCCNHIGMNPKQIQRLAGHSSVLMTMDTYAKLLRHDRTSPILEYLKRLMAEYNL
ncbi:MAG: tyrosine-type recombinase/integrase [Firmicutes bacterium]|nr:tyrosine-type recombinase/integrase [Bacillota bacterium]